MSSPKSFNKLSTVSRNKLSVKPYENNETRYRITCSVGKRFNNYNYQRRNYIIHIIGNDVDTQYCVHNLNICVRITEILARK